MSRYQAIQKGLLEINETLFQELCDKFLALENKNYIAFTRTGSQVGKQKTIRGTPDTFMLLPSGQFIFVETTTNVSNKNKLRGDVEACFDLKKSKIEGEKIDEIILCYNFNLDQKELDTILNLARKFNKRVTVTFWSLDRLAMQLQFQHGNLVSEYLQLPFDTGQIVSLKTFIEEYNKKAKGVATPLNSTFLHRTNETIELQEAINNHDFVILTGVAGVGKTKLVIETLEIFLEKNLDYHAYCISYKNGELLQDLYTRFDKTKSYLLFVDDANRVDALNQILGFYNIKRTGNFKIILTTRSYALNQLSMIYSNYSPVEIRLNKLSNEQVLDIVKSEPYGITNSLYHPSIARISNGNPRIAIMAAVLARKEQDLDILNDVSELFQLYFSNFIEDNPSLLDKSTYQTLGLISFFYTLSLKKEIIEPILRSFGLEYFAFIDSLEKLEKHELVEIQYQNAKIPEQNLSTYFFYRAFIKDKVLSFDVLLSNYYTSNRSRFKDTIIPVNNYFGGKEVMAELHPYLKNYWKSIENDLDMVYPFAHDFWFYLQTEVTFFLFNYIKNINKSNDSNYKTEYDQNEFAYKRNDTIKLIANFLQHPLNITQYLELLFEYGKKEPSNLPEILYEIRSNLGFSREDERYNFARQFCLIELFEKKLGSEQKENIYLISFWELAQTLLQFQFQHIGVGMNSNSFTIGHYILPNTEKVKTFRRKTWELAIKNFKSSHNQGIKFLDSYGNGMPKMNNEICLFDIPYIFKIIDQNLSPQSFDDCKLVHNLILWLKRRGFNSPKYSQYLIDYNNPTYQMYITLDWNRLRDKENLDFPDYDEYSRLKEAEIRTSYIFKSIDEFEQFHQQYLLIIDQFRPDLAYDNKSLNFVIDENFNLNFSRGIKTLEYIIQQNNSINFTPILLFQNQLKQISRSDRVWETISKNNFNNCNNWRLIFFGSLDKSIISEKHVSDLLVTISEIKTNVYLWFSGLEKFLTIDKDIILKIVRIVYEKNEEKSLKISLGIDFFGKYFDQLGKDHMFIKKLYLQQQFDDHADYKRLGLKKIIEKSPEFLIDFLINRKEIKERNLSHDNLDLSFVWDIDNIESSIKEIFDYASINLRYSGISKHFCNVFYVQANQKSNLFLINYLNENYKSNEKVNIVVDIARHTRKELFSKILLQYLNLNQSVEDFSKIYWRGNGGTLHDGDSIISELEAFEWRELLEVINQSDIGISSIPIKAYLQNEIDNCVKSAVFERERKFLVRD